MLEVLITGTWFTLMLLTLLLTILDSSNQDLFWLGDSVFPNTDLVTIPGMFKPLLCSLERLQASMKMSNFKRKCSPEYQQNQQAQKIYLFVYLSSWEVV